MSEKFPLRPTKMSIYDNAYIQDPNGVVLSLCSNKRTNWYLDRNIAELIQENPRIIRLKFHPSGRTFLGDPFFLSPKYNRCVVCGDTKDLTRHHIVPSVFRKCLKDFIKSKNTYDIMPMCIPCHATYEVHASNLKTELRKQYGVPQEDCGILDKKIAKAKMAAFALLADGHKFNIPPSRKEILLKDVEDYLDKDIPIEKSLMNITKLNQYNRDNYMHWGEQIMNQIKNIDDFFILWRNHFLEKMQPKYLHENWESNRRICEELEKGRLAICNTPYIKELERSEDSY